MSANRQSWITGSFAMLVLNICQRSLGLIGIMLLTRLIDAKGLGAYAFSQSLAQTMAGWTRFGLDAGTHTVLAASVELDHDKAKKVIAQSLGLAGIVAVGGGCLLIIGADIISIRFFAQPGLTNYVYPAALLFVAITLSSAIYAVHSGLGTFAHYARAIIVGAVFSLTLMVGGALIFGALGAAWAFSCGQLVMAYFAGLAMHRVLRKRAIPMSISWPRREAYAIVKRGFPFFAGALFALPAEFVGYSLLARQGGVDALGDLRVTQAIMAAASALPSAIMGPLITHLSSEYSAGRGEQSVRLQLKLLWVLSLLIAAGFAGVWPIMVDIVAGPAFVITRKVGDIAVLTFVPAMILNVLQGALLARGSAGTKFLVIGALQGLAFFVAAYLLVPAYGLAGFLVAQAISLSVAAAIATRAWAGQAYVPRNALLLVAMSLALGMAVLIDASLEIGTVVRLTTTMLCLMFFVAIAVFVVLSFGERERLFLWLQSIASVINRMPIWRAIRFWNNV